MRQKDVYLPDTKYYQLQKLERKENDNTIFHVQTIEYIIAKEKISNLELITVFSRNYRKKNIEN